MRNERLASKCRKRNRRKRNDKKRLQALYVIDALAGPEKRTATRLIGVHIYGVQEWRVRAKCQAPHAVCTSILTMACQGRI